MHCYFNLVSSHRTIIDEEGLDVTDWAEAHKFAQEAAAEMISNGVGEVARWRGWRLEGRDASGTVLFTVSFDTEVAAGALSPEGQDYAYDQAA